MSSFKKELFVGVTYTALSKYVGIIVGIVISAILARLLTPSDFGVIAVAMVFIAFFSIMSDLGISAAIIQKKELTKENLNSIFSFTVYFGLILGLSFFFCSFAISYFYSQDSLLQICQFLSISLFFNTINIVPSGLLKKAKRFRFLAVRSIVVQIILGVLSVFAAYYGAGVYALLINPILGSIIVFGINYYQYPQRFRFFIDAKPLKRIASYSLYSFGFSVINYFSRNLDTILIGKYIGMVSLGYYEKSYRLMLMPVQNITSVFTPVLHPILSNYQNDLEFIYEKFERLILCLFAVGLPITVLLYFSAREIILLLYGSQWIPAISVFSILALTTPPQLVSSTFGAIYQATNNTKSMFFVGIINTILSVLFLLVGLFYYKTIEGVAWMWLCALYLGTWCWWYIFHCIFHKSIIKLLKKCKLSFLLTVLLAGIYYVINVYVPNMLVSLSIKVIIGGGFILYLLVRYKYVSYVQLFSLFKFVKNQLTKKSSLL